MEWASISDDFLNLEAEVFLSHFLRSVSLRAGRSRGRWTLDCACLHDRLTLTVLDEAEGFLRAGGLPRYRGVALLERTRCTVTCDTLTVSVHLPFSILTSHTTDTGRSGSSRVC
jgi:hypothetical protein